MNQQDQIKYGDISGRILGIGIVIGVAGYVIYRIVLLVMHHG